MSNLAPQISPSNPVALHAELYRLLALRGVALGLGVAVFQPDGKLAFEADVAPKMLARLSALLPTAGMVSRQPIYVCKPDDDHEAAVFGWCERRQVRLLIALVGRAPKWSPESIYSEARHFSQMVIDHARVIGLQCEVDSLSAELATTYEELNLIYRVSSGMKVNRGASEFFKQACVDVTAVLDVQGMGVFLRPGIDDSATPAYFGTPALSQEVLQRLQNTLLFQDTGTSRTVLLNDLSKRADVAWFAEHASNMLALPLQRNDEILGCIFCLNKRTGEFNSIDAKLLSSIANECAIYLENAVLFQDARSLMMGLLRSMVSAVDAKDPYTCGHSERVALLSRELATVMKLPDAVVDRIYMAGLLHDVGKIGVSEAVLHKPGTLTAEEFAQMKQHPEIGARILQDVPQLDGVIPGVLHHHERWDGTGYPRRLAGEAIPLAGRIICVADCFDAMTSNRTYRRALPFEVALEEMRRAAGTQFDPNMAAAFLSISPGRLLELTAGHHEQAYRLIEQHRTLRVA